MRIIAGEWRGRRLKSPGGKMVRPTSGRIREAWMGAIGPRIRDARVLDLFAGSGALGLEALSRGALEAVFVERSKAALTALERNIEAMGAAKRARIVRSDYRTFLDRWVEPEFDLALADPPYDRGFAAALLERMASDPFARELWVEHRSSEIMPRLDGLIQRRYGDTTLSIFQIEE